MARKTARRYRWELMSYTDLLHHSRWVVFMIIIISDFPILWPGFHLVVTRPNLSFIPKRLVQTKGNNWAYIQTTSGILQKELVGINSGSSFRNKPIILEAHDSTNCVYDHVKTRPMRHSAFYLESSTRLCVYVWEKVTGPVGVAQKLNFHTPHWWCAELDKLTIWLFDRFSNFMKYC